MVIFIFLHCLTLGERHVYFEKMKSLMAEAPLETKIHFELASFVDDSTLSEIKKNIIPYTDSIGMNEQEQRFVNERKISIHYTNYRCFQLYVKIQVLIFFFEKHGSGVTKFA